MTSKSPPPTSTSKPPPPVAEKPNSSSFKDRIAAFNKPAAAPITPFKPGGGSGTGFIKKPFVAPPPSRNAYVPPPREQPVQKPYHREEEDT
ncbi:assembly of actin patch protein, partial [Exophiala xenobiotica]